MSLAPIKVFAKDFRFFVRDISIRDTTGRLRAVVQESEREIYGYFYERDFPYL